MFTQAPTVLNSPIAPHTYLQSWFTATVADEKNVSCQFCFGFKRKGLSVISTGIFLFPLMYLQEDTSTRIRTGWSNLPVRCEHCKRSKSNKKSQVHFPTSPKKTDKSDG